MKAVRGAEGGDTRGRPGDGLAAARIPDDPEIARTVIMHRFPLEEAVEALRAASDKASKAIRIVIERSWHPVTVTEFHVTGPPGLGNRLRLLPDSEKWTPRGLRRGRLGRCRDGCSQK